MVGRVSGLMTRWGCLIRDLVVVMEALGPWKSRRTTSTDLSLPLLFSRFPMVPVHRTWAT